MARVRFIDLAAQFAQERDELMPRIEAVLASGMLIGGEEVAAFEAEIAAYCGVKHAIGVNSGTDALAIGMKAAGIGPGDEVITPPNSFISSTSTIVDIGGVPVFADVCENELIDPDAVAAAITPRTAAIMPVHLRGGVCDMPALARVAEQHGLLLIEDAAQAIGSALDGKRTGGLGQVGCFSTHPLKLLNATGDGGFITTNDDGVAERARVLRNIGLKDRDTVIDWGSVSRLDAMQAAILRFRLGRLDDVIDRRRAIAARYLAALAELPLRLPRARAGEMHTYNTFTIQTEHRDALQAALVADEIEALVHYSRPLHRQPVAAGLARGDYPVTDRLAATILSLPVHQFLTPEEVERVISAVVHFFEGSRASASRFA